jgi:hypothetical protein
VKKESENYKLGLNKKETLENTHYDKMIMKSTIAPQNKSVQAPSVIYYRLLSVAQGNTI